MRSLRGRTPHPRAGSGLGRSDLTPTDGVIGLGELKIRSVAHRQAEISYAVHTVLWGQGYGEAIARSLVEVGRAEGMHRIAGTCDPRNGASARVLQKIGMSYEGRMRHTPEQPEKDEPGWSPTLRPPRQRDVWVAARGWRRPHAATMSASCSQRQKRPCLSGDPRVHPRIGRESCALWQPAVQRLQRLRRRCCDRLADRVPRLSWCRGRPRLLRGRRRAASSPVPVWSQAGATGPPVAAASGTMRSTGTTTCSPLTSLVAIHTPGWVLSLPCGNKWNPACCMDASSSGSSPRSVGSRARSPSVVYGAMAMSVRPVRR